MVFGGRLLEPAGLDHGRDADQPGARPEIGDHLDQHGIAEQSRELEVELLIGLDVAEELTGARPGDDVGRQRSETGQLVGGKVPGQLFHRRRFEQLAHLGDLPQRLRD